MFRKSSFERSGSAPASSAEQFREMRIANLKKQLKLWFAFGALAIGSVAYMLWFGSRSALFFGGLILGFIGGISLVGWMIGFDVRAVTYIWGSWGEEDTCAELARLGDDWYVRNYIPNPPYGNWDHVAIGPPGIFMIDSKRLTASEVIVDADGLSAGSIRLRNATFSGAAYGLHEALAAHQPNVPWVNAIVAVWGNLPAELPKQGRVVYLNASRLVEWLEGFDPTLDATRRATLVAALEAL